MKSILTLVSLLTIIALTNILDAQVRVRGHFRKDGTYVSPHYRSNPDGLFWNNWSTKGNVNPYTGKPGTKVTPPSSYRSIRSFYSQTYKKYLDTNTDLSPKDKALSFDWSLPSYIDSLALIADPVSNEDVIRAQKYCEWLYGNNVDGQASCVEEQMRMLASVVLPDYSDIPLQELSRAASYCEWLYGDNRAGFYDCLNRQIFGLLTDVANFDGLPENEVLRAKKYCEWLYGDNRAGCQDCLRHQATLLKTYFPVNHDEIPLEEWARVERYSEWLYGDNRGQAVECLEWQARKLRYHLKVKSFLKNYDPEKKKYCEWLYGDNRAGFWDCVTQ